MYSFPPALTLLVDPAHSCVDRMAVVTRNHIPAATCPRRSTIIAWKRSANPELPLLVFRRIMSGTFFYPMGVIIIYSGENSRDWLAQY
jgi:hypothetical protein